ncbi:MAG: hypothetical protein AAF541_18320 [Pseudomonadota bacterium]
MTILILFGFVATRVAAETPQDDAARGIAELPAKMQCVARQTAGFHDFPHNEEAYEAVVFFESKFELRVNRVLMAHLVDESPYDLFLTLMKDGDVSELQCSRIRGAASQYGVSCSSQPPADLLLLNLENLRFTRTAIGGWTFVGDSSSEQTETGESIYVEYGACHSK